MHRTIAAYVYLALVGVAALGVVAVSSVHASGLHSDSLGLVAYLVVGAIVLNKTSVRLDRGRLTLLGLPLGAAAILLTPIHAAIVGLSSSIGLRERGSWPLTANAVIYAAIGGSASWLAIHVQTVFGLGLVARFAVLSVMAAEIFILVAAAIMIHAGEALASIAHHNFTISFFVAFGYQLLAALLTTYLLDGSLLGYVLASIVFVLAFALTDTIAGRRIRRVLESELSDADRHLFHSRAVEGVVHNLRNHVASAVGYLKEIDLNRLDPVDREAVETATAAGNDAVAVLRSLQQGATPRVSYATTAVDLNEIVSRALGMARPRARSKETELALRESPEDVKVKADPLLLREVITNLINNAIDAAPKTGHVELATGRRNNGWPYVSVGDDGPGVADENRHHLFEPHFTTKEGGTGLGLFMSYGIVREHQGDILYSHNRPHGAVFTVTLPPFGD